MGQRQPAIVQTIVQKIVGMGIVLTLRQLLVFVPLIAGVVFTVLVGIVFATRLAVKTPALAQTIVDTTVLVAEMESAMEVKAAMIVQMTAEGPQMHVEFVEEMDQVVHP